MITQVKAKYVVARQGGKTVLLKDASVYFEEDTILHIGREFSGKVDRLIDESDNLLCPGFIDLDALGDIDHTLIFFEVPHEEEDRLRWSERYFLEGRAEAMTQEEENFKSLYAYVHLIRNGITTAMPITSVIPKKSAETYEEIEAAAHHAGRLGLRVYLGPSFLSAKHVLREDGTLLNVQLPEKEIKQGLADARRFLENFHGTYNGLVQGAVVPERIELQTEESLKAAKALSEEFDVPLRLHASQSLHDYNYCKDSFALSPVAYLESIGFLGPNTMIPHTIVSSGAPLIDDTSDDDQKILVDTGTTMIHCPLVYARNGKALHSFGRYQRLGVRVTMGTDTFPPDMIENIKIGQVLAKAMDSDRKENYLSYFFHASTIEGARALGREDLGVLTPGAKADMIVIDLDHFDMGVIDDPLRTVFVNGNGQFVKTSIIAGRVVMENRMIEGVNMEELQNKAQSYYERMKKSYSIRSSVKLPDEEFFHTTFPVGSST